MSDCKAKIHQIRFPLRPDAAGGSLQRFSGPLAGFKGPTSKGTGMGKWKGEGWERGERGWNGEGK